MRPQTVELKEATARSAWTTITAAKATTPERQACVIAARRMVGEDHPVKLVQEYKRLLSEGTYAELNTLPLSAGQTAELAVVVNGGAAGVRGYRLDSGARQYLARQQLITAPQGSPYPAQDSRATVHATLRGIAVVRAAQGRTPRLSTTEAMPLSLIERAMSTADGGAKHWPGNDLCLRVAQIYRLVEYARQPPSRHSRTPLLGAPIYRLTDGGVAALELYRQTHGGGSTPGNEIGAQVAEVLEFVGRLRNGDPGASPPRPLVLEQCIERGWVRAGGIVPHTSRRRVMLTERGRDALAGWSYRQAAVKRAQEIPTSAVKDLLRGQWVRMRHRKGFPGIGPQWVRVEELKHAPVATASSLPRNYELWVTTDSVAQPYLYGGRPLYYTVRFEVRNP